MTRDASPPPGYVAFDVGAARVVCRADCADGVRAAVDGGRSLWAWAAARPEARALRGRAAAYAVRLPGGRADVVVRHSWHGGVLAPLTRDLFLPPTRAPRELDVSRRLTAAGVRTPELIAYVVYRAGRLFRRADVATRLVDGGRDLAAVIADASTPRTAAGVDAEGGDAAALLAPWVRPTGALLHALARVGAVHPDLNAKNVLLTAAARDGDAAPDGGGTDDVYDAWALDVDVVRLPNGPADAGRASRAAEANWERLARSLRKWRDERGLAVLDAELGALREYARRGPRAAVSLVWLPRTTAAHAS